MGRTVIVGAGELGGRVARLRAAAGHAVLACTRTAARHPKLLDDGLEARTGLPDALAPDDRVLIALPGADRQMMAVAALRNRPPPARAVFVSSTGYYGPDVYGDVDEETPPGTTERAQRNAAAEQAFAAWAGGAGVILRLGGLYRPGRGPMSALARSGRVPPGPPDKTLALIHYDDAAAAAAAALAHPDPQRVYLAVTPPCPLRRDFYLAASVVLGLDLPGFDRALGRPPAVYDVRRLRSDLLAEPAHARWQGALVPGPAATME